MGIYTLKMFGLLAASVLIVACSYDDANDSTHSMSAKSQGAATASGALAVVLPWESTTVTEFSGDPSTIALAGKCSLEGINGAAPTTPLVSTRSGLIPTGAVVKSGGNAVFNGWMGDANGQVPTRALLVLQGPVASYAVKIVGGGARPDVAKVIGSDGLKTSGYVLKTTLSGVTPGDYRLWLVYGGPSAASACRVYSTLRVAA
ncbi:hypothetical protein [Dyella tabacisoli]|uniref:Lipoprotein n=1 Tax=Dyella tabacisoli TaxID=2282381 RepID=A0A369URS4_9GAMM|nr:hypothetical protein [Dyella tabacisoli]RDD83177.1 hypothetical protein DVJ77_00795 [Dyella tabacisoli]